MKVAVGMLRCWILDGLKVYDFYIEWIEDVRGVRGWLLGFEPE